MWISLPRLSVIIGNWDEWVIVECEGYIGDERWSSDAWNVVLRRSDGLCVELNGDDAGYDLSCYYMSGHDDHYYMAANEVFYLTSRSYSNGFAELTRALTQYSSDPLV
jgi:hypothetical protein